METIVITGKKPDNRRGGGRTITILGKSYTYDDRRGFSLYTMVNFADAKKIILSFPAEHYYPDRLEKYGTHNPYKLSWSPNGDKLYLMLHIGGVHIYTSKEVAPQVVK